MEEAGTPVLPRPRCVWAGIPDPAQRNRACKHLPYGDANGMYGGIFAFCLISSGFNEPCILQI